MLYNVYSKGEGLDYSAKSAHVACRIWDGDTELYLWLHYLWSRTSLWSQNALPPPAVHTTFSNAWRIL